MITVNAFIFIVLIELWHGSLAQGFNINYWEHKLIVSLPFLFVRENRYVVSMIISSSYELAYNIGKSSHRND